MNEARSDKMVTAFVEEPGGVYKMTLINGPIASALNVAASEGDKEANGVLHVLAAYFDKLAVMPERSTCLACDRAVNPKAVPLVAMIELARDDSSVVMLNCMCKRCVNACPDGDSLTRAVLVGYGREMMKNPRVINPSPIIGHA